MGFDLPFLAPFILVKNEGKADSSYILTLPRRPGHGRQSIRARLASLHATARHVNANRKGQTTKSKHLSSAALLLVTKLPAISTSA